MLISFLRSAYIALEMFAAVVEEHPANGLCKSGSSFLKGDEMKELTQHYRPETQPERLSTCSGPERRPTGPHLRCWLARIFQHPQYYNLFQSCYINCVPHNTAYLEVRDLPQEAVSAIKQSSLLLVMLVYHTCLSLD